MIEQWMHVRAKIPINFKFDVKLRVTSEITCILTSLIERFLFSHRPKFVDLQYKEIKIKEGAKQK